MRKLSETTARQTIGMMRSIANHVPISPFHLMAADEMEQLLNEVVTYRAMIDAQTLGSNPKGLRPSIKQLFLFKDPMSRNSDPETSHEAANEVRFRASRHRLLALTTLKRFGPLTDYELAARTGLQQNSIGKRRKECQDAGLIEGLVDPYGNNVKRPAPSGSKSLVWQLTREGDAYVGDISQTPI